MRSLRATAAAGMVAASVGLLLVVPGRPAGGMPEQSDEDEGVELEVAASFDRWIASDRPYPVFVTVTSDHLLRGSVLVEAETGAGTTSLRRGIEVSGGSTERYGFLVPPASDVTFHTLDVRVLDEDGAGLRTADVEMRGDFDHELVGMLPDVAARHTWPEDWGPLTVEQSGVAHPVVVDPDVFTLGSLALDPLDQIVATSAELAALPAERQAALASWVDAGGQLLVVGEPEQLGDGLPEAWRPQAGESVRAGLGTVRSVGEDWMLDLLPSATRSVGEEGAVADSLRAFGSIDLPLAEEARASLRPAGGLGLLLGLYVVVAGPVLFLVARAIRRRQLVWVAVPVLALGSSGVVLAGGSGLRSEVGSAHVTVYETGPAGTRATTWSLLASTDDDTVGAQLPEGWTAGSYSGEFDASVAAPGGVVGDSPMWVEMDDDGAEAVSRAGLGTYSTVEARGPVPDLGEALVVTARSETDGQVVGTIRNQLDVPLDHVVALVGRAGMAEVGTLGPGEEREFELTGATDFRWDEQPETPAWPTSRWDDGGIMMGGRGNVVIMQNGDAAAVAVEAGADVPLPPPPPRAVEGAGEGQEAGPAAAGDAKVVASAWFEAVRSTGWNYRPIGQVVAVGWTDELASPLEPTRGAADTVASSSAVVARSTVAPAGDRLTDAAVVRSYVRGPNQEVLRLPGRDPNRRMEDALDELNEDEMLGLLYSFELPEAVGERPVDPNRLTLGVPDRFDAAAVWTPGGWVPVPVPGPGGGQVAVPIPPDAMFEGQVFVRAAVPLGSTEPGHELVLYEREGL